MFNNGPHNGLKPGGGLKAQNLTLNDLNIYFQDRNIVVVKELTKIYENIYRGDIKSVIADLEKVNIKGEYIIVIQGFNN